LARRQQQKAEKVKISDADREGLRGAAHDGRLGGLLAGAGYGSGSGLLLHLGCYRTTQIVELHAAIAAMIKACPEHALDETEDAFMHSVDVIAGGQARHAIGAALGAPRVISQVKREPAGLRFASLALATLIDRHVQKSFR
jgi:hypothetical protein